MDALFPIKIDIPDNNKYSFVNKFDPFMVENKKKIQIICFLISYEEDEKISIKNKRNQVYHLGKIKETIIIDYIEILNLNDDDLIIDINNKSLFIEKNKYIDDKIFLFNNSLYENKKKERQLNSFSINEEFDIYYKIHSEKNKNSFNYLVKSALNLFTGEDSKADFGFFLTVYTKKLIKLEQITDISYILINIKNRGDLTKISKEDLYQAVDRDKIGWLVEMVYFIFQDIDNLKKLIIKKGKKPLIECYKKFNILFEYNLELYPKYSFLMDYAHSIEQIKIILKCSKNFLDIIFLINYKKKKIHYFIKKEEEEEVEGDKIIIINGFFNRKYALIEPFDEKLYLTLDIIKEFEMEREVKLFYLTKFYYTKIALGDLLNYLRKFCKTETEILRMLILLYLRNEISSEGCKTIIFSKAFIWPDIKTFNNYEKITLVDILLNDKEKKISEISPILLKLIEGIEFNNLSKEVKIIFFKIKWENIFQNLEIYIKIVLYIIGFLDSIEDLKFLYELVDKLIVKENDLKKIKNESNEQKDSSTNKTSNEIDEKNEIIEEESWKEEESNKIESLNHNKIRIYEKIKEENKEKENYDNFKDSNEKEDIMIDKKLKEENKEKEKDDNFKDSNEKEDIMIDKKIKEENNFKDSNEKEYILIKQKNKDIKEDNNKLSEIEIKEVNKKEKNDYNYGSFQKYQIPCESKELLEKEKEIKNKDKKMCEKKYKGNEKSEYINSDKYLELDEMQDESLANLFNEEIIIAIKESQKKFLELLENINNDNINEKVDIMSKLIYFSDKYNIMNNLLENIITKLETKILNEIFINILANDKISNEYFEDIITLLVKNGKFGNIYNFISGQKLYSKFQQFINKHIIDEKDFLDEKVTFNISLLYNLKNNNHFNLFPSSFYTLETNKILENIGNKIIILKNISYGEMLALNQKEKLELFSSINNNKIIISLNNHINIIETMIKNIDDFLNDFEIMPLSQRDKIIKWANDLKVELKNKHINSFEDLKEKINKIETIHILFKDFKEKIKKHNLFKMIENFNDEKVDNKKKEYEEENENGISDYDNEENDFSNDENNINKIKKDVDEKGKEKTYSLFEQILFLVNEEKCDEISPYGMSFLSKIFSSDLDKKKEIIKNISEFYYFYYNIYLNDKFYNELKEIIVPYKEISDIEIDNILKRYWLLCNREKINEVFEKYILFKIKLKKDKGSKANDKLKIERITINNLIHFLSLLGIKEDMIIESGIKDIINYIENTRSFKIIDKLSLKKEVLDFILSTTSQDCRNLQELAGEVHGGNNQNFLSIEQLLSVEKIIETFENLLKGKDKNENEDEVIIYNLTHNIDEAELDKFIDKYPQYKEFFSENLDKSNFTAEIIQKILNKSEFFILNSNDNNFKAFYKNEANKDSLFQNLSYDYMIYLRDRALTRAKIKDSILNQDNQKQNDFAKNLREEEEIIFNNNKIFIRIVHQINELLKLLNKLIQKGFLFYFDNNENINNNNNEDEINKNENITSNLDKIDDPLLLKIQITIEKDNNLDNSYKTKFFFNGDEMNTFSKLYEMIQNIYDNIVMIQKNGYLKKKYINFIYGKQFQLFFDYFYNNRKSDNLDYYLCYFTNKENVEIKNIDYQNQKINVKEDLTLKFYQDFIEDCEAFLDQILNNNKLSLELILEQNKMKQNFIQYKGIYLNGCNNLEKEIIFWYKFLTNNMPLASTLLLCKQDTSFEEIISFLYRAILCRHHICFCLARTEFLSEEKKNIIQDIIIEFFNGELNDNKYMNSCLLIMNSNLEDELCKSLFRLKFIKPFDIPQDKLNDMKIFDKNDENEIIVIHSDQSGAGKSTYIKNCAKGDYIYFPVGGIFTKKNTLKRLQNLDKEKNINEKQNLLMHVDLYDTDQKSLMNDFLYFILITKLYGQDNNIFYLSKKINIYLEIPNSFIPFLEKYPILKLFPEKILSLEKLEPLIVPDDICSNIKIVSLYLKLLKEKNDLPANDSNWLKADNKIDKNAIVFPFTPPELVDSKSGYDYNKIVIKAEEENKNLTPEVCEKLIFNEIEKTIKKPTYYQITTFINVLANQLLQFNRNFYLSSVTILDSGKYENCKVRSLIIKKFIDLTKYFTKGAFTELLNEQKNLLTLMNNKNNEQEKIENANNILEECEHESISFEKMDLALIFFHGGDNSIDFSIITNKNPNDKTYIDLLNLRNIQSGKDIVEKIKDFKKKKDKKEMDFENLVELNDYRNYTQEKFLKELKSILDIKNPENENDKTKDNKDSLLSLTEITKDYVFTADNFIKMCLILIRFRANVPVIMMGETGCGKTSLIRKLSELQNNGKCLLIIDNIHAGHTNEDIINFIEKNVIPKAKELAESQKEKKESYKKNDQVFEEKKLWVFFDELNTCKSMDLLSEIICKHSCQGKILPENIVFIGAANPYRKAKQKKVGLKINKNNYYEESDLVYTVNPMPHSLLNFVFDFGSLNPNDEKKYIANMIKREIFDEKLSHLATELIATAQNFIREQNDISSVSLREIRRFIIFYKFFLDYLKIRKEIIIEEKIDENEQIKYSQFTDFEIQLYSINLAIYLGYYLRLTDTEAQNQEGGLRNILYEKLNQLFKTESKIDFLTIPEKEENFIADNVELEKGIAKNRALLENLFSLFIAINTKIPIFILGKPGCSKSLSVQLINNAMKGSTSTNSFFKRYPKMYVSTYQGALNSTSEGVKAIFEKAREILKVKENKENKENKEKISTIYFDEMGLAEHSPHNPLKVIHSELEYDLNQDDKKVSFLGVSNWSLDSSKMNRGITISIPDPNESDIKKTSITIAKSYLGENLSENIQLFFENLGSCYYKYKQEFKKTNIIKKYEDFHGNRDFYHLIKYPSIKLKEALKSNKKTVINDEFLANLSIKSLERNFGGLNMNENKYTNGINLITEKLSEYNNEVKNIMKKNENYNIKEKIMDNLTEPSDDYLRRYLLLITTSNIGIYLVSSFLKSINGDKNDYNNYTILIGSFFIDDIEKEEYTTKILSKIKMNIEKDTILVLKDFESIYPSLYDLFNQNFVKVRGKKYARIALGNKTNSFSEVNNRFRCIIIVEQYKLNNQEIPFLNRFEKQSISFEYLMNPEQISIANKIYEKCQNLIKYDEKKLKFINYHINNFIINCNLEEILGIVYMETQGKNEINDNDYEIIENKFISKISITLPQDIILILLINKNNLNENEEKDYKKKDNGPNEEKKEIIEENKKFYEKVLEYYNKNTHNNIKSFLSHYENENNKIIIYTFTRIIDSIKREYLTDYEIKSIGEINNNNIKQIRITTIDNEFNLETEIEEFLENNNLKIFILKILPQYSIIDYLKTIIENKETEFKVKKQQEKNKLFIFLVHIERVYKKDAENPIYSLSTLAEYNQIFIDDINGQDYFDNDGKIITLDKMLKMKESELYKSFVNLKTIFIENLNNSLCYFDYSFNLEKKQLNKDIYIGDLIELFIKDELLIYKLDEIIMKNIICKDNESVGNKTLLDKMLKEEKFNRGDICIYDIIKKILNKNYINIFKIQKN